MSVCDYERRTRGLVLFGRIGAAMATRPWQLVAAGPKPTRLEQKMAYPLVMTNIAMENHPSMEGYSWENHL